MSWPRAVVLTYLLIWIWVAGICCVAAADICCVAAATW
jgi:hypothetical protein